MTDDLSPALGGHRAPDGPRPGPGLSPELGGARRRKTPEEMFSSIATTGHRQDVLTRADIEKMFHHFNAQMYRAMQVPMEYLEPEEPQLVTRRIIYGVSTIRAPRILGPL